MVHIMAKEATKTRPRVRVRTAGPQGGAQPFVSCVLKHPHGEGVEVHGPQRKSEHPIHATHQNGAVTPHFRAEGNSNQ